MSNSHVRTNSNKAEQCCKESAKYNPMDLLETVLFHEFIRFVTSRVRACIREKLRNVIDIEQVAVDVLDEVIRKFRTHPGLRNIPLNNPIPHDTFIEIKAYCIRVEKNLVSNAVRNATAGKRGHGILPVKLNGDLEPAETSLDPAEQAECKDVEDKLFSRLGLLQQTVLRCRQLMLSNVEISEETKISLRRVERLRAEIKSIAEAIFRNSSQSSSDHGRYE